MSEDAFDYPPVSALCANSFKYLDRDLVAEKHIKNLENFNALLPQKLWIPRFTLECPLNKEENWADIMFQIDLQNATPIHDISTFHKPWQTSPGWHRLARFAKACHEQKLFATQLRDFHHQVWVEFDVASSFVAPDIPSIFLDTCKMKTERFCQEIVKCRPFFCTESPLKLLAQCASALPDDHRVAFVGFMLSRSLNPIRMHIRGAAMNRKSIEHYLTKIGAYASPALLHLLKNMEPIVSEIALDLDITENGLNSKIGLNFFIHSQNCTSKHTLWSDCFNTLNAEFSIDMSKCTSSLNWCGQELQFIGNSSMNPLFFLASFRHISHLKCIYESGKEPIAKIYLETTHALVKKRSENLLISNKETYAKSF